MLLVHHRGWGLGLGTGPPCRPCPTSHAPTCPYQYDSSPQPLILCGCTHLQQGCIAIVPGRSRPGLNNLPHPRGGGGGGEVGGGGAGGDRRSARGMHVRGLTHKKPLPACLPSLVPSPPPACTACNVALAGLQLTKDPRTGWSG